MPWPPSGRCAATAGRCPPSPTPSRPSAPSSTSAAGESPAAPRCRSSAATWTRASSSSPSRRRSRASTTRTSSACRSSGSARSRRAPAIPAPGGPEDPEVSIYSLSLDGREARLSFRLDNAFDENLQLRRFDLRTSFPEEVLEQARDAGTNLAFFSANSAYWRVRFEPSGAGEPDRVMVCYKDPAANDPIAPTYRWRDPENNRPENALLGVMYTGDDVFDKYGGYDHIVANSADPYYEFTGLNDGDALLGLVGFEWDAVVPNGFTPSGLVVLSQSIVDAKGVTSGLPPGTDTTISNAVRYTATSGAKVFATGARWLHCGLVDAVLVGGADSLCLNTLYGFNSLQLLSPEPCRPSSHAPRSPRSSWASTRARSNRVAKTLVQ